MSRTLKRPMFRRGGSTNDGIMTGIVDREQKSVGDVAGRARELTPELEALLREFTPKTKLPIGQLGLNLASGKFAGSGALQNIIGSLQDPYSQFVKADDAREAAIRSGAVKLGIGQAMAEAKPSTNILKNRKTAIVNIKANPNIELTEENILKETARLNKLDEAGKDPSMKRLIARREELYLNSYGDGSKARNHASFDFNVAPKVSDAGKVPKGRIKLKDGVYDTKRKTPGVYIDVDNGKVIEITSELKPIELKEFTALL
jgi:hypothetical protein